MYLFKHPGGILTYLHEPHNHIVQIDVTQSRMVFALSSYLVQKQVPAVHRGQQVLVFPEKWRNTELPLISKLPQPAEGSLQGTRGATMDGYCCLSSYSGHCSEQATQQPTEQPSTLWWRTASDSLGLEGKTWTKNTSRNPHSWQGPWDPNIHSKQAGFQL